jgi:hypothetical protein
MNEALFTATPGSAELLARRIQQSLRVILAGLEERVVLMPDETEDLRRDLGMLLHRERLQIASAEVEKAEEILRYIVLCDPASETVSVCGSKIRADRQGDWESVRHRGRPRVSRGLRPLGAGRRASSIPSSSGDPARPIPPQYVSGDDQMYARDAHCRSLVKRGLRIGVSARLKPIERIFLCWL